MATVVTPDIDVTVAPCAHDAARWAVEHWHYSHRLPVGKLVKYGAWERGRFIGVVLFGRGATGEIGSPFGLAQTEVCELVRVALDDHNAPTTAIVATALRKLHSGNPGLRLVVSFADTAQGHAGVIYQAGNWVYLGSSLHSWLRVHGELVHPKTLHARYGFGGQSVPWLRGHIDPKAERVEMPPKHKYAYPLDRPMRRALRRRAVPYPGPVNA